MTKPGIIFLLMLLPGFLLAQIEKPDGVYLTFQEFSKGTPTYSIDPTTAQKLLSDPQTKGISLATHSGEIFNVDNCDIWAVVSGGRIHISASKKDELTGGRKHCVFGEIELLGTLSSFNILKSNLDNASGSNNQNNYPYSYGYGYPGFGYPGGYPSSSNPRSQQGYALVQYIVDLRTGEVIPRKNLKAIKSIIKQDTYFKRKRIKDDNLRSILYEYNRRNPISTK